MRPFSFILLPFVWLTVHPVAAQPLPPNGVEPSLAPAALAPTATSPLPNHATVPTTVAPPEDARQQARQRFETGMKLYEEGDYALALLEFERAHSLVPGYRVLYNIGQVNIQLGRYARAARKLRQYLAEGANQIPDERRLAVLSDLDMLAGRTSVLLVSVNVPGAEVLLDNEVIAVSPMSAPMLVDAGEHRVTVRKPGYVDQTHPLAMASRDQSRLDFVLLETPKFESLERTVVIERPGSSPPSDGSGRHYLALTLGWTGTGLLATAWAITGGMGFHYAAERRDKLDEAVSAEELSSMKQRTRNWYIAADICGGLTIASAMTMVYYTLVAQQPAAPKGITVGLSPSRLVVTGQF